MTATPPNPYAADLGDRDVLDALADTPAGLHDLVSSWSDERWAQSYAPGKWTARQIVIHLAQTELALTTRARFALGQAGYVAQPFNQDEWVDADSDVSAQVALDVYRSLRAMNLAMWKRLSPEQRARPFEHPEYGTLTVWWIASQLAGHDLHHLKQLASIP